MGWSGGIWGIGQSGGVGIEEISRMGWVLFVFFFKQKTAYEIGQ